MAVTVDVAVAVGVEVSVAVAVLVAVTVSVEVGVAVTVAVAVGVALVVTVTVGVDVGGGSMDGVAVGEGVSVAVMVGVALATGSLRFLIRICCGANTVVPPRCSSAVRSYSPGATASMRNVLTEEAWVGWKESPTTCCPFCLSTFSRNRYSLSGVFGDGWTVVETWTICD